MPDHPPPPASPAPPAAPDVFNELGAGYCRDVHGLHGWGVVRSHQGLTLAACQQARLP